MRVRRSTFFSATLVAAMLSLAVAGAAMADVGSGDMTATPATTTTDTKTPVDTSTKPPVDTSTKPPTDTSTPPVTELPKPTPPVTEPPKTSTCESSSTCGPICKVEPCNEIVCKVQPCNKKPVNPPGPKPKCVPSATVICGDDSSTRITGSGDTDLPFTGPGDVVLAIVLALLAGSGGILFLFGASGREQLDTLNRRGMDSPSGFHLAYRELRKDQLDR